MSDEITLEIGTTAGRITIHGAPADAFDKVSAWLTTGTETTFEIFGGDGQVTIVRHHTAYARRVG